MPTRTRRGQRRSGRGSFLDALLNAVVTEVRGDTTTKRVRPAAARDERRVMDPGEPTRIGAVRLGLRREGERYDDFSGSAFRGELTNDGAASALDDVIARRMRAAGLDAIAEADAVDPAREAGAFARRLSWELRIPGDHYSGMSNQALLDIRKAEGRDFNEDTRELRDHIRDEVVRQIGPTWDDDRAARIAGDAIVKWVVRRIEEQGLDMSKLEPLNPEYRAWKARQTAPVLDTRIGIARGVWLKAVKRAEAIVSA
jgi:hypothetical protein